MRNRSRLPVLVAAVIMLAACGADPDGPGAAPPTTPERSPVSPPATSEDQPEQPSVPASLDFTATTVDGATFDAAELAGEPVVFWFWAPWCPRCVASAPDVLALAEDVTVVGVGGLAPDSDMRGFVDRTGMGGLTHLSDPDGAVWGMFGVTAQETMVVIDADGEVVHNGIVSPAALRERLDELI
jgi:thiol-disulfide isomerase/thioredoxin